MNGLHQPTQPPVLQIIAIVTFVVLFACMFIFFLTDSGPQLDNLQEFTRKAKQRQKQANYLKSVNEALQRNSNSSRLGLVNGTLINAVVNYVATAGYGRT